MSKTRYKIVSASEGTLAVIHNNIPLFSREEAVVMDFLSKPGAEGFLSTAVELCKDHHFPTDCSVVPFIYTK